MSKLIIYTDGGSRGNPGPAGAGAIIYDENRKVIAEISEFLGITTNNQAEYRAILAGIKKAVALQASEVEFYLDSELAVKQLNREYKVKNKDLAPLVLAVYNLTLSFTKISFTHIPRERNSEADRLANEAMDRGR